MAKPTLDSLREHLSIHHGHVRDVDVNLYACFRDEMFFLPAFFHHYRGLGVEQFLILDDRSEDGTREYLAAQKDCVVLSSSLTYEDRLEVVMPDGTLKKGRAWPHFFKSVIPRTFLRGKLAISVDGDEFLVMPAGVRDLRELLATLDAFHIDCVAANMVEFYPRSIRDLEGAARPASLADLIEWYGYFDAIPLLELQEGDQPRIASGNVTNRLVQRYTADAEAAAELRRLGLVKPDQARKVMKNPIIRWADDVWMIDAHVSNEPPTAKALLALAHFKFTHDFFERVARAVEWKSHGGQGVKYRFYDWMGERMLRDDTEFGGGMTAHYTGPEQLEACGLMKWELPVPEKA